MTVFEELQRRGLLAQLTDEEEIKELIRTLSKTYPDLKDYMLSALQNTDQYGLWDTVQTGVPDPKRR